MGTVPGLLFVALAMVALIGAAVVVGSRDIMRVIVGLGAVLLAVAGLFAVLGLGFLAVAEIFLYVGGVLVLFLFAIMLVHRGEGGRPMLESRLDPLVITACVTISAMLVLLLRPLSALMGQTGTAGGPAELSTLLLGPMLPQFEAIGALLLAALVGVVIVMGGDRR
jgi:NADH-quinone oxidoreductase subunit J